MRNKFMAPVVLALTAGLCLTACCTRHKQATAAAAPVYEPSGAEAPAAAAAAPAAPATGEVVIPLHQEVVNVGKRTVDSGQVTIKKQVTTQTITQPVQLRQDSVVISREAAGAEKAPADTSMSKPFEESSVTIQLQKEEPVVQKGTVVSGNVVARKGAEMQQTDIQSQVKQETVQIQKSPNTPNVSVQGNLNAPINEAAGAQAAPAPAPSQAQPMAPDTEKGAPKLTEPQSQFAPQNQ